MLIEQKEYEEFGCQMKKVFNNTVSGLIDIWRHYYSLTKGDAYDIPHFTKEEAEKLNSDLDNSINVLINNELSAFNQIGTRQAAQKLLLIVENMFRNENHSWFYNELDCNAEGRIEKPADMFSIVGNAHMGSLNIIIGCSNSDEKDTLKPMILEKYGDVLDKQAQPFIDEYKSELEMYWDAIIFINMKNAEYPIVTDLGSITDRKF